MCALKEAAVRTLLQTCLICVMTLSGGVVRSAPWDEPQDTAAAFAKTDAYAWQLFVALNWPADIRAKTADPTKKLGDLGPAVWETWRNVRTTADDTVFKRGGGDPGPWLTNADVIARNFDAVDQLAVQQLIRRQRLGPVLGFDAVSAANQANETRMNKTTYEFVREKTLYNVEGQEALVNSGVPTLDFPVNSKEIKAQWREVSEADKPRYHWTEFTEIGGGRKIYGLVALHITTKDLPNWLWATFEHIDNKIPEANGGRPGNEGWLVKSRDRAACPTPPHDCEAVPTGFGLEGTKWQNYHR
jgi:hypothetical protein